MTPLDFVKRVPIAAVDAVVTARLGAARVKGNAQPAAFNRQVAMYLAREMGHWSLPQIGRFYNGRHHTTVMYAVRQIAAARARSPEFAEFLDELREDILSMEKDRRIISALTPEQREALLSNQRPRLHPEDISAIVAELRQQGGAA